MGIKDPRVDAYIARSAEFARPILEHLRQIVHKACPEVEETLKWSMPHFMHHGMLAGMSAFKQHCAFGFWKASMINGAQPTASEAMGQFGRITTIKDLPSAKVLGDLVKQAMRLNEEGIKAPRIKTEPRPTLQPPDDFLTALRKLPAARASFSGFSSSQQREYVEWILDAKTDATRERRMATALEWLAEGKTRNWKYAKC